MNDILIIAGPSAVGKTTVAWEMLKNDNRFEFVRSATTREVRGGDGYSSEYIYVTREEFEELIRTEGVLEWTEYAGAYYGTPRSEITRIHAAGRIPLLILDVVGVHSLVSKADLSVCGIYVWDKLSVMEERILLEGASAMAVAAVREYPERVGGSSVAIVVSGGNADGKRLASVLNEADDSLDI